MSYKPKTLRLKNPGRTPRAWTPAEMRLREWMLHNPNICKVIGVECGNMSPQFVHMVAFGRRSSTGLIVEGALRRRGCPMLEKGQQS